MRLSFKGCSGMCLTNDDIRTSTLLREKWPSVETLLRRAGLARDYNPAKDFDLSRSAIEPVFAAAFRQSGMHARIICAFGDSRSENVLGHPRRTNRKQIK